MLWRLIGLAIGVWFVFAPFMWGFVAPGSYPLGFTWWHSIGIGVAVIALSASFLLRWYTGAGLLLVVVGLYSLTSPFLYGYYTLPFPMWNDIAFGVATVLTGAMLAAAGLVYGGPEARTAR